MAIPWGPIIGAVGSIAGGLLSRGGSQGEGMTAEGWYPSQWQSAAHDVRMFNENERLQKEFAQMGVRWRVQDAKEAGLHPLFALGGNVPSGSPMSVGALPPVEAERKAGRDFSAMGQGLSRAVLAAFDTEARERHQKEMEVLDAQAEKDYALAAAAGSRRALARQGYYASNAIEMGPTIEELQGVRAAAVRSVEAPIGQSLGFESLGGDGRARPEHFSNPHIAEKGFYNADPFWQQFSFRPGFNVILPKTSEPQEVFEDKPLWFWAMVAKANVSQYGMGWLTQARQQFPSLRQVYDGVVQELKSSGLWFGK